jgi:anthranilate synthase/aminodeoxychorismate synthase-like glutamine amidotransferase
MILVLDNYDSFVYNLARYLGELGCETRVLRNDAVSVADVAAMAPQAVVISPGPCTPAEAGISVELVRELSASIPTLGVCLGHQAIGEALGARVVRASTPVHGTSSLVWHDSTPLFAGIENPFCAARYHSLCVVESTLPPDVRVTARTDDGVVMAVEHHSRPLFGVQFHPESVLTNCGHRLLANFLKLAGIVAGDPPPGDFQQPIEPVGATDPRTADGLPIHWW